MLLKYVFLLTCASVCYSEDKKWIWGNNARHGSNLDLDSEARYEVFEGDRPYSPKPFNERPPHRPDFNRPIRPGGNPGVYPGGGNAQILTNGVNYPDRNAAETGILTGPVPSWVKEGPYKNFDKCKCTEKFNCNSPGISYGHCDTGKQYCCYSTNKHDQLGGPNPSQPIYSPENGILVGPEGPIDGPRPQHIGNRPRPGGFGSSSYGPIGNRPEGVLVGPGGPYDRPYRGGRPGATTGFGYGGRSNKN